MAVIYKIENTITNQLYIGKAIDHKRRWDEHLRNVKSGQNHPLYNSIRKYGKEYFNFEILEIVLEQNVNEQEIDFIKKYNTLYPFGFNLSPGGTGGNTRKLMTENQIIIYKNKLSESAKEKVKKGVGICAKSVKGKHITETYPEIAEKWKINYIESQNKKSKRFSAGKYTQAEINGYKKLSELRKGKNNPRAKKIKCVETNQVFGSMSEAMQYYNINSRTPIQTTIKTGKQSKTQGIKGLSFIYL
jgi:group I intron endonuclease